MPLIDNLVAEKVTQAIAILNDLGVDAWLTFAQEVGDGGDPAYPIIFGERDLGSGLLLLTRRGERISIVGGLDAAIPASTGVWDQTIVHGGDTRRVLLEILQRLNPGQIAINYSLRNVKADGLSYGKYLQLQQYLAGTPYLERLCSANDVITRLRTRKSPAEVALMQAAIATTDDIFTALRVFLKPGLTGRDIYNFILGHVDRRGLQTSWSRDHCPVVTVGPVPAMGHTPPGDVPLQRGWTLQVDFGVKQSGFCSDFQRMFYVLEEGQTAVPADVQRLFLAIKRAIGEMTSLLRPGNPTWQPAARALEVMLGAGYPEFKYGVGHQLGRVAHDGGPSLVKRVAGQEESLIEAGNVFTVEGLETLIPERGWVSQEEDVLVTEEGPVVLTNPQQEFWLVKG
jgi:Xaa-Pro aminopeptidase